MQDLNEMITGNSYMKAIINGQNYKNSRQLALLLMRADINEESLAKKSGLTLDSVQAALAGDPAVSAACYSRLGHVLEVIIQVDQVTDYRESN
ncbi:hypothetical protein ACFP1L_08525 [Lactiplantibacillus nangangensis]|uniref:Transcriptional regulator n=1 Tax=Lactiplantibacillus nangangensis TaxID=2559917 RepID=A0ABW1SK62_9LACO|nr:hypothetical protein [Lactiplantibacillus nangangensis]